MNAKRKHTKIAVPAGFGSNRKTKYKIAPKKRAKKEKGRRGES